MSIFARLQQLFHSLGDKEKNKKKSEDTETFASSLSSGKPEVPPASPKSVKTSASSPQKTASGHRSPTGKPAKKKRKTGTDSVKNRTGIPILEKDADIERMMQESRPLSSEANERIFPHYKKKKRPAAKKQVTGKNRHGIPVLRDSIDFNLVFHENGERTDTEEDFAALLEKSLGAKELDRLLHEKKQKPALPPLSLKERLARYPSPEESLDLHGFSGIQASLKTEIFLEEAKHKGLFTVRIITGKGLHSEGMAILPGIVEQKILELKKKDWILAHKWENKRGKPNGSVRVYLKRFD